MGDVLLNKVKQTAWSCNDDVDYIGKEVSEQHHGRPPNQSVQGAECHREGWFLP
jgi:hypothetical protein